MTLYKVSAIPGSDLTSTIRVRRQHSYYDALCRNFSFAVFCKSNQCVSALWHRVLPANTVMAESCVGLTSNERVICWRLRASAGRDFFFLMTLRVPLIHYVDISRRHSHKCVCTIMVINVQNQQFSASPNSSNVTNLAKRSEFCWKHGTFRPQVVILGNVPGHLGIYRRAATAVCFPNM